MNLSTKFPALPTIAQTAKGINFSYSIVRKWTYGQAKPPVGWPESILIGRSRRYRKSDIEAWIAGLGQPDQVQSSVAQPTKGRRGRPRKVAINIYQGGAA